MTAVVIFAGFIIIAYLAGTWGDIYEAGHEGVPTLCGRIAAGGCLTILTCCIASFFCSLFGIKADTAAVITAAVLLVMIVSAVIAARKMGVLVISFHKPDLKKADALWLIPCGLIVYSIIKVMSVQSLVTEAVRGMDVATYVYESGNLMPADPMMLVTGIVSRMTGTHPLYFVYNVSPPVLIAFYNICALYLVKVIFTDKCSRLLAFTGVCLMNIWGYQSDLLSGATLLLKWFGSGVLIVHGIAPTIAAMLIYGTGRYERNEQSSEEYPAEEWDMNHKFINSKNLAIAFAVLALVLVAVVFVLNNKINRLYDATVNLQNDINSRCSVYEYASPEGDVVAYLLKGSDGSITVIGGGGEDNANPLGDFITSHGGHVDKWYIYSEDDENAGAMNELISAGKIDPDRIFVIDRKEITHIR